MNGIHLDPTVTRRIANFIWKYFLKELLTVFAGALMLIAIVGIPMGGFFYLAHLGDTVHPAFAYIGWFVWLGILCNLGTICKGIDDTWFNGGKKVKDH